MSVRKGLVQKNLMNQETKMPKRGIKTIDVNLDLRLFLSEYKRDRIKRRGKGCSHDEWSWNCDGNGIVKRTRLYILYA
jgi:hypothetical protein